MSLPTIYIGASGHEHCGEAIAYFVALDPDAVEREFDAIERDELTDYRNSMCSAECAADCLHVARFAMWHSGAWIVERGEIIATFRALLRHDGFASDDLRAGGVAYLPHPY